MHPQNGLPVPCGTTPAFRVARARRFIDLDTTFQQSGIDPLVTLSGGHELDGAVTVPLAGEILSLCMQFESQIQTKLHGRQNRDKVSEQMNLNQARFNSGRDDFVVYPSAFPASPKSEDDIWAFASLGENLRSCPNGAVPDLYWNVLRLRNAVAHGHYVGWAHARVALRMLRYFDRLH